MPQQELTPDDTPPARHRAWMEERFGPLRSGRMDLVVNDASYDLFSLLHVLGLDFEDVRPIDAHVLADGRYAIRYLDPEECGIVAYEFDAAFRRLDETFVHIGEWLEEAQNELNRGAQSPWSG